MTRSTTRNHSMVTGTQRVNLLPPRERDERDRQQLLRRWIVGLIVTIGFVLATILGAHILQFSATQELVAEQNRTTDIQAQLTEYTDVTATLTQRVALEKFVVQAGGTDLSWMTMMNRLDRALPGDVELEGFALAPGGVPTKVEATAAVGVSGSLTVTSSDSADIPTAVQNLRRVEAVIYADVSAVTWDASARRYTAEIDLVINQTAYSGRFTAKER